MSLMWLTCGKVKVQPSTGIYLYNLLLWEQLLKVGNRVVRVKNVMAHLAEKESAEPPCVVHSFKAACRRTLRTPSVSTCASG